MFNRLVANGVETGIITNGSSSHQRDKIIRHGEWITNNAIYTSSEVGSTKPKLTIFDLAAKGRSVNDFMYVGDSMILSALKMLDGRRFGSIEEVEKSLFHRYRQIMK